MTTRDRVAERVEWLRGAVRVLGCTRSEALALAVLLAGSCAALALLWSAARSADHPARISLGGSEQHAGAADPNGDLPADPDSALHAGANGMSAGSAAADGQSAGTAAHAAGPVVHVSGLVANPGVYDLPEGGRVADALRAAGGTLPGAQLDGLNLARVLADGEQVHVPGPDEEAPAAPAGPAPDSAWLPDGRLDINRATVEDFQELPGIGPVLSERIVAHREELGGFESIGDLLGVHGIGEKTLAALADLVGP